MAAGSALSGEPQKWPPPEYFHVRRPMEEWVPPLEVLKEMERDEPHRFRKGYGSHESRCMILYQEGKSQEEVFREISSKSKEELKAYSERARQAESDHRLRHWGLFPNNKEQEAYRKQSAGGFRVLKGTSQGSRFAVPPKTWIEEELIALGARSELIPESQLSFHVPRITNFSRASWQNAHTRSPRRDTLRPQTRTMA